MAEAQPENASLFQGLESPDGESRELERSEPAETTEEPSQPDPSDRIQTLEQKLEEIDRARREAETRLDERNRSLDALLRQAPAGRDDGKAAAPEDPGPAPDPQVEPEKFTQWLQKRDAWQNHRFESRLAETERSMTEQQRRLELWHEFQSEYPDAARDEKLVAAAFQVETNYTGELPSDTDALKKRVAERIRSAAPSGRGETETRAAKSPDRTAGVSGGSRGGKPPASKGSEKPEKPKGLTDIIAGWQDQPSTPFF